MDDEDLINAVRDFPCLWHVGEASYRNTRAKEYTWKEVAARSYCKSAPDYVMLYAGLMLNLCKSSTIAQCCFKQVYDS